MKDDQERWTAIDDWLGERVLDDDPVLRAALETSAAAGLPAIQVTPAQGKFLQLLAQIQRARAILEIGTLGGYSTIHLARALPPNGRLITLELEPKHAEVAVQNVTRAKLAQLVEVRVGPALVSLSQISQESSGPFDFIFIDADKQSTADYFVWALKLSRKGTVIVVDNIIRKGAILDAASTDPAVQGMRRFIDLLGREPRVTATALQTVGGKGYDGFAMAVVQETVSG